jgi:cytochrome bd-type quinol oxidase subunit 1
MTFSSGYFINVYGRKILLVYGLLGIAVSLLVLTFFTFSIIGVLSIYTLVFFFSLSLGPVNNINNKNLIIE